MSSVCKRLLCLSLIQDILFGLEKHVKLALSRSFLSLVPQSSSQPITLAHVRVQIERSHLLVVLGEGEFADLGMGCLGHVA